MGVPTIKKKIELQYRRARTSEIREHRCCWFCGHLRNVDVLRCDWTVLRRADWRCIVMGIRNSNRYNININSTCDRFKLRCLTDHPEPEELRRYRSEEARKEEGAI